MFFKVKFNQVGEEIIKLHLGLIMLSDYWAAAIQHFPKIATNDYRYMEKVRK